MKLKMQSQTKKYSLIGVSCAICILMIIVPLIIKGLKIGESSKLRYSYKYTPQVTYTVGAMPCELYAKDRLQPDQYYLLKYIDKIYPVFSFDIQGSSVAPITVDYQIVAQVRGYVMKDQEQQIIWQKESVLVPQSTLQVEADHLQKEHTLVIDLNSYKKFIETIFEDTGIKTDVELCVKILGKLNIEGQGEPIEVPIDTSMLIPLEKNYFQITRQGQNVKEEEIRERFSENGLQLRYMIGAAMTVCTLGIGVFVVIARAGDYTEQEIRERRLKKIVRMYGSHFIEADHLGHYPEDYIYKLRRIEDLIKIAEEREEPIFYLNTQGISQEVCFFIIAKERLYVYEFR